MLELFKKALISVDWALIAELKIGQNTKKIQQLIIERQQILWKIENLEKK